MSNSLYRKIFFWLLAVLFVVTAIFIIIYSFGYRFNRQRGIFIYTGSVTLKSIPRKISIQIDKHLVPARKINFLNYSYHIDGLHPGEHSLTISAPRHLPWHKNIIIHSGISTEFWNIFLAKNHYQENFYPSSYQLVNFFIAPSNNKIALVEKDKNIFKIKILKIEGKLPNEFTQKNIFSTQSYIFPQKNWENIEWSPDNKRLIIPLLDKQNHNLHYFVYIFDKEQVLDLNQLLQQHHFQFVNKISHARWDSQEKNKIFFLANNSLYHLELDKLKENDYQPTKLVDSAGAYDISDGNIYFISSQNKMIYKLSHYNHTPQIINSQAFPIQSFQQTKLVVYDKTRAFIIDDSQNLYVYNQGKRKDYQKLLSNQVANAQFSDDGKKLLFWNNNEIFVYFTRDWETQPFRAEDETQNLTRFSQKINNVQWYKDYEHVIFNLNKTIKIIELDQRDYRNMQDLFNLSLSPSKITYNSFEERLYFPNQHNTLLNLSYITLKEEK